MKTVCPAAVPLSYNQADTQTAVLMIDTERSRCELGGMLYTNAFAFGVF